MKATEIRSMSVDDCEKKLTELKRTLPALRQFSVKQKLILLKMNNQKGDINNAGKKPQKNKSRKSCQRQNG